MFKSNRRKHTYQSRLRDLLSRTDQQRKTVKRRKLLIEKCEARKMWAADGLAVAREQTVGATEPDLLRHFVSNEEVTNNNLETVNFEFDYGFDSSNITGNNDQVFAADVAGLGFDQTGVSRNVNIGSGDRRQILIDSDRDTDEEYLFRFGTGTGIASSTVFAGDFNGDGFDDIGVAFDAGGNYEVHLKYAQPTGDAFPRDDSIVTEDAVFSFGFSGPPNAATPDRVVAGDFNADGRADIAMVRQSGVNAGNLHWFVSHADAGATPWPNNALTVVPVDQDFDYGLDAHVPVAGDWDDSGQDYPGAVSLGTGAGGANEWLLATDFDTIADITTQFGLATDAPYVGNFADVLFDGGPSGTGTDATVAANWSGDTLPSNTRIAVIDQPGNSTIGFSPGSHTFGILVSSEIVDFDTGTVTINGPSKIADLRVSGSALVANAVIDAGAISISGGALQIGPDEALGTATINYSAGELRSLGGSKTLSNNIVTTGDITPSGGGDLTLAGVISGSGGIDKPAFNTGQLTLTQANTYTGQTTIGGGILQTDNPSAIPSGSAVVFSGDGILNLGNTPDTLASISGTTTGGIQLGAQTLTFGDATNTTFDGPITGMVEPPGSGTGGLVKVGTGTFTINSSTSYDGNTTISEGRVVVGVGATLGVSSTTIINGGTTLEIQDNAFPGMITMTGTTPRLELADTFFSVDTIDLASADSPTIATRTSADTVSISGFLTGSVSGGGVNFDGGGTFLVDSGYMPSFTGTGTSGLINGTSMQFDGTWPANSDFAVGTDSRLSGTGTFNGALLGNSSGATVAPGPDNLASAGRLTVGGLNFPSANQILEFEIGGMGSNAGSDYDQITSSGTVTLGGTLSLVGDAAIVGENYTIIENNDSGAVVGTFNGLPEGASVVQGGTVFSISYVGGDGNDVVLSADSAAITWDGGGDGVNWNDAANWSGDALPGPSDGVSITTGPETITSSGSVSIGLVTSTSDLTVTGGTFSSGGQVTVPNLTVDGGNYIANHSVDATELVLRSGTFTVSDLTSITDLDVGVTNITLETFGGGAEFVVGNRFDVTGTLTVNNNDDFVLSGDISGAGQVVKDGPARLRMTNNNVYNGLTTINAGEIFLTNSGLLGTNASGTIINGNATLRIDGGVINSDAVTLQGINPRLLSGSAGGTATQAGDVILAATNDAFIQSDGALFRIDGQIGGSVGGDGRLNTGGSAEASTLQFASSIANTYSATTHVNVGNLQTLQSDTVQIPGDIIVGDSDMARAFLSLARPNTVSTTTNVTLNSDAYLDLDTRNVGSAFAVDQTINNLTVTATALGPPVQTASQIDTTSTEHAFVGTLTVAGTYTQVASGEVTNITGNLALTNTIDASNFVVEVGTIDPAVTLGLGSSLVDGVTPTQLNLSGGGSFDIDGSTTHTGGATVTNARLNVDGIIGDVDVLDGGMLSGFGTTGVLTTNGTGTIAPGNSPGILTTGDFTLGTSGTLEIEIGGSGANPGEDYDQVDVTGTVTLGGVLNLVEDSVPIAKETFTIINNDGTDAIVGEFTGIANGDVVSVDSREFIIRYNGGDGNDVVLLSLAAPIMVTNANDSGAGSLRQAIIDANVDTALDLIHFDIPGAGPHTIAVTTQLPAVDTPIEIDGATEPDYAGQPVIGITSGGAPGIGVRFVGGSDNSVLRGVSIYGFTGESGLVVQDTSNVQITGNYLGVQPDGVTAGTTQSIGLQVIDSSNVIIGGLTLTDRNVISANTVGVEITGANSAGNVLEGNFIGTDQFGFGALGNVNAGVLVESGAINTQVGVSGGTPNVVSGNTGDGIIVDQAATTGTLIVNNLIGTDRLGNETLPNDGNAIELTATAAPVTIGGSTAADRNIIVGSPTSASTVFVQNSDSLIYGNYIGTDITGTIALGGSIGVAVSSAATSTMIGGASSGQGNLIAGLSSFGIRDQGDGTVIQSNHIGTDHSGNSIIGAADAGIFLFGSVNTVVGGPNAGNTISGITTGTSALGHGIFLESAGGIGSPILIQGNRVGISLDGSSTFGVSGDGITLSSGSRATIGGQNAGEGNMVGGAINGIFAGGDATIEGNFLGVAADGVTEYPNQKGVRLAGPLSKTVGPGNLIAFNTSDGIETLNSASHFVVGNLIYQNGVLPIDVGGDGPNATNLITIDPITDGGSGAVTGTGPATYSGTIYLYAGDNPGDASALVGSTAYGGGTWMISGPVPGGKYLTAYASGPSDSVTEFSQSQFSGLSVTTTADSGPGSLRQAIIDANVDPNHDVITFNIAGAGPHVINLASGLPGLLTPLTIDGYSDPEASPNTLAVGNDAVIEWQIDGGGSTANGLAVLSEDVVIRGLSLTGFSPAAAINVNQSTSGTVIEGNFIGLDANGSTIGFNQTGIFISGFNGSAGVRIGTDGDGIGDEAERNLISGNFTGIEITDGVIDTQIAGNYIGTDRTGLLDQGNSGSGISANDAAIIGGDTLLERNVISGNDGSGIGLSFGIGGRTEPQLAWYEFENNLQDRLSDSVGFTDSVGSGTPSYTTGTSGNALDVFFPVSAPRVPTPSGFNPNNGTIDFFAGNDFSPSADGDYLPVIHSGTSATDFNYTIGFVNDSFAGNVRFAYQSDGVTHEILTPGRLILDQSSNHIAVTIEDQVATIYVDGKPVVSESLAGPIDPPANSEILLGSDQADAFGTNMTGRIDELGIHGRALNETELLAITILNGNGKAGSIVQGNYIGLGADGVTPLGNATGIVATQTGTVIGGYQDSHRNIISSSTDSFIAGIQANFVNAVTIAGNYIGTDASGTLDRGNAGYGIWFQSGVNDSLIRGNVVSGNGVSGGAANIQITNSFGNRAEGNVVGLNAAATTPLASFGGGIVVDGGAENLIGGPSINQRNVISGNAGPGVELTGTGDVHSSTDGWWSGEGNNLPNVGSTNINVFGSASFGAGLNDGQGFLLPGNSTLGGVSLFFGAQTDSASTTDFWFNADDFSNSETQTIATFGKHVTTLASAARVDLSPSGEVRLITLDTSGTERIAQEFETINADTWYHGALTHDGNGNVGFFINGKLVSTGSTSFESEPSLRQGFGFRFDDGGSDTSHYFAGRIDEVAKFFEELPENEIRDLYSTRGLTKGSNRVQGNYIGTDFTGMLALPNGTADNSAGIIAAQSGAIIGGATSLAGTGRGNLISGNDNNGLFLDATGIVVQGNSIGLAADGVTALTNGQSGPDKTGILVGNTSFHLIGGGQNEGNVISGNDGNGYFSFGTNEGVRISGNFIGTDVTGMIAVGNGSSGIFYDGGTGLIVGTDGDGFDDQFEGNVISGNADRGIRVSGGGQDIVIAGNIIGLDAAGTNVVEQFRGISVDNNAPNVTIGGLLQSQRNVIAGNTDFDLITFTGGADGLVVLNNFFGTDISGSSIPGDPTGGSIGLFESTNVRFGERDIAGSGNLMSFGSVRQIQVSDVAGFEFYRNRVGTDVTGNTALVGPLGGSNALRVETSTGVIIGAPGAGNQFVIGSSTASTVLFSDVDNAVFQSNIIGANSAGSALLGSSAGGLRLLSNSDGNLIGTDGDGVNDALESNLFAGGTSAAVFLGLSNNNTIAGNRIGVTADGRTALGSGNNGVTLDNVVGTTVGGDLPIEANVVAGFLEAAINVDNSEPAPVTSNNLILGNLIGVNIDGLPVTITTGTGIVVNERSDQTIIRDNTIGNTDIGIDVAALSTGSTIQSNLLGINDAGVEAANRVSVLVRDTSSGVTIGGTTTEQGNTFGFHTGDALLIEGGAAIEVMFNRFGVTSNLSNVLSTAAFNQEAAIRIDDDVDNLKIGTDSLGVAVAPNVIGGFGVGVDVAANVSLTNGLIRDNVIGTDTAGLNDLGNRGAGIQIAGSDLEVTGNTIAFNDGAGVSFEGGMVTISQNRIYENAIGIDAGNDGRTENSGTDAIVNFPSFSAVPGSQTVVSGTFDSLDEFIPPDVGPLEVITLEFFASQTNPASGADAERFLGAFTVDAAGGVLTFTNQVLPGATISGEFVTATAAFRGITGEFSDATQATNNLPITIDSDDLILTVLEADEDEGFGDPTDTVAEGKTVRLDGLFQNSDGTDAHTVSIDWRDGSPIDVIALAPGVRGFTGEHIYLDNRANEAAYDIRVIVADDDGQSGLAVRPLIVTNVPAEFAGEPSVEVRRDGQLVTNPREGDVVRVFGDIADAGNDSHTVTVRWDQALEDDGDAATSSPVSTQVVSPGVLQYDLTFVYTDNGDFDIEIELRDDDSGVVIASESITTFNADPVAEILSTTQVVEGSPITLFSNVTDPGSDDTFTYEWTVWNETGTLASATTETFAYTPENDGTYGAALTVTDDDGGFVVTQHEFTVINAAPVISASALMLVDPSDSSVVLTDVNEGDLVRLIGTFSDAGILDDHTIAIDFGDGAGPVIGTIEPLEVGGEIVPGQHTFFVDHVILDDNPTGTTSDALLAKVNVTDDAGAGTTATLAGVTVSNVAPDVLLFDNGSDAATLRLRAEATDVSPLDTFTYVFSVAGGSDVSQDSPEFAIPRPAIAMFDVVVTAIDDDGNSMSATVMYFGGDDDDNVQTITDEMVGTAGQALVATLGGNDMITIMTSPGTRVVVDAGEGADTITGGAGNEVLDGGAGSDVIDGGDGDDILVGASGDDTLIGGAGNDIHELIPGSDKDIDETGGGNDTVSFRRVTRSGTRTDGVTFDLSMTGAAQIVDLEGNTVTLRGTFENAMGTSFDDTLVGNNDANLLDGGDGKDVLRGGAGDLLFGGSGNDAIFGGADGSAMLDGGTGDDVVNAGSFGDQALGGFGNDTIYGGGGQDTLGGGQGNDLIFGGIGVAGSGVTADIDGGEGNDEIHGGSGDDRLFGGTGNDAIFLTSGAGADSALGGFGNDTIFGGGGSDDTLGGGSGNDLIFGGIGGSERLEGGTGDDEIHVEGDQLAFGGFGNDMIIVGSGSGANVSGGEGSDTIVGGGGGTLDGGGGSDFLSGGFGSGSLLGGLGDDTIFGGSGDETLGGGGGNDLIFAGLETLSGDDVVRGDEGDDIIYGGLSASMLDGGDGHDLIFAKEVGVDGEDLAFTGLGLGNEVEGGTGNDTVIGGSGNDDLSGGSGNDLIISGDFDSLASSALGGFGNDTIYGGGGGGDTLGGGGGNDLIFGGNFDALPIENPFVSGSTGGGDNIIEGGDGIDTLIAGDGVDMLIGGAGRDLLIGGSGTGGGIAGTGAKLIGGAGNDTIFAGSGDDNIQGEAGDDLILAAYEQGTLPTSGGGNNLITGGTGNDRVQAGLGSDQVFGEDGNDFIIGGIYGVTVGNDDVYEGGEGNDTLLGGEGDDTIRGNGGDDQIFTGGSSDLFSGLGNDSVSGGDGNDTLFGGGGGGTDTLHGDAGNDLIFGDLLGASNASGGSGNDIIDSRGGIEDATGDEDDDLIIISAEVTGVDGGTGQDSLRFEGDHDLTLTDTTLAVDGNPAISVTGFESASLTGGDGDNTISADAFSGNATLSGGLGDDVLVGGAGNDRLITIGGSDSLIGMSGDDVYEFGSDANGTVTILEGTAGGTDRIDLRELSRGVTIDLKEFGQQSIAFGLDLIVADPSLTSLAEIESVTGTGFADTILANDLNNTIYGLGGRDLIDGRGGADVLYAAGTRLVYVDFDSVTDSGEHIYTQAERDAITARIADDFTPFDVQVSQTQPASSEEFVTVLINAGIPGGANRAGISEKVGFRELLGNSTVRVDVNVFLRDGGNGLPSTPENFIALTSTVAAHELAHLFGVRHQDAFGDVGQGIYVGLNPNRFRPLFTGPTLAEATINHLISSPSSVGTTLVHAAGNPFLGPRESLKLAFGETGNTLTELAIADKTTASVSTELVQAQAIGELQPLRLPVTVGTTESGNIFEDTGAVASVIVGAIEIDPSTGFSESDYYTFEGVAGQVVTIEVMSETLRHRLEETIDSVLRVYTSDGSAVTAAASSTPLRNDDTFESADSILLDVVLPADDVYTVEVDTFSFRNPEYAVVPNDLNIDTVAFCTDNPDNFNCTDVDTGQYELLIYSVGGDAPEDVGGDTLIGGDGPDEFIGSSGDETIPDLSTDDTVTDPFGTLITGIAMNPIAAQQTDEGTLISFTVSVADPLLEDITYSVATSNGDALPAGITFDPQTGEFTYAADDEASFELRFTATDPEGMQGIVDVPIVVFGLAPELQIAAANDQLFAGDGETVVVFGKVSDASPVDVITVLVDWGDGTVEPATVGADGSINISHIYAVPGPYSITLEAEDDDELASSVTTEALDTRLALIDGVLYAGGRSRNDLHSYSRD